ncbi:conserved hypothetical protein [Halorhabdus utahensis DSM 12940]|uniref:UspA domain-containing protein n=1 Tax=Halorhabdus utahensis (strain DSM 12940 / JCM 11049 / AX-2) TaxID=519442 RepID=C7NRQ7_HALUD|nr:universal stress protein [Halorhabdus utahensis]ACV13012.1 conserved hypothetical protein [Halorhabdus utahensis DSM 12940]
MGTEILIPTDCTDRSGQRLRRALDVARRKDATVHALYVVDTQRYGEPALSSTEVLIECFEDEGRDHLRSLVEEGKRQGVAVDGHCRRGDPATEVARAAEEFSVDLVIPCLSGVTASQLRHKGLDADRIADPRAPVTA